MQGKGPAICLPGDIDTDLVIAGRYLRTKDKSVWATHVLEDLDPTLAPRLKGAVIVAGKNFGCGSSREQAAFALREAGVIAIIAPSFGRIFFRNAINIGLPLIESTLTCTEGTPVAFDLSAGWVDTEGKRHAIRPLSARMQEILEAGGLVEYWRAHQ
ncbi:3-isopropylmalate dehydratase, small subunit [Methanoregula boonei 6A8]|jgi:methanogen homoaconitase small subunit|uniref:3-isopropylmalate dehydratase, small subunit n=1 Tax=Methanoregula boonei (strain DSM 21154 / JCM 14090 / 6A8) TaxID=456442 RepID=A7I5V7_METB6|nr:3-isopropylmalate dehydratase small subunit [Methanoregula boonei]ABS55118.1 3-isopropylmalate dehydratase, small subunit [Methanoregula boonei 6A8]